MATYYASSNNQRDSVPMIYMPGSFPEAQVLPGNVIMYMNNGQFSDNLGDSAPHQQEILSNFNESRMGDQDFNAWRDGRNEMLAMQSMAESSSILHNEQNSQGQGLSLSLSTQIPSGIHVPSISYPNQGLDSRDEQSKNAEFLQPGFSGGNQDSIRGDLSQYGMTSVARTVPSSKYLKAAQQLLDEVVNVRKALKQPNKEKNRVTDELNSSKEDENQSKNQESTSNVELSNAERQELQNKLTKLLSMLDEVDRRYKQYYHQMQIVVSSFDVIAGCGAVKPYTALALQTISRHFRCLRDAICGQIQATRKSLGDQETSENGKGVGITRLRYVDQQLRQQRALQQLGMMQQHAWRPQRGLPESSVSILRAWLFEHFLHPYPKDSDKIMLARQTGLTRSQVSNWFINARVRLWKPMVEEMYKEEIGDVELDSISSSENAAKASKGDTKTPDDKGEEMQQTSTSIEIHRPSMEDSSLLYSDGNSDRFMAAYHVADAGSFGTRSGVSLTLGLQHCEGADPSMTAPNHHGFVYGGAGPSVGPETTDFECLNPGNRQHRFGPSHLLHDFVA